MEYVTLTSRHRRAVEEFVNRIPARDRGFLDPLLLAQFAVQSWTAAVPERRIIAVDGDMVAGLVTVAPEQGWSAHVAEVRVIVDPAYRGQGVGRALAGRGIEIADEAGLCKLFVEIMENNTGGQAMFKALGFEEEARLSRHVRDGSGRLHDMVVMSRWIDPPAD